MRGSSPLVRIVDTPQTDVLLVLEETVEVGVMSVETQLREHELDVGPDQGAVACEERSL